MLAILGNLHYCTSKMMLTTLKLRIGRFPRFHFYLTLLAYYTQVQWRKVAKMSPFRRFDQLKHGRIWKSIDSIYLNRIWKIFDSNTFESNMDNFPIRIDRIDRIWSIYLIYSIEYIRFIRSIRSIRIDLFDLFEYIRYEYEVYSNIFEYIRIYWFK